MDNSKPRPPDVGGFVRDAATAISEKGAAGLAVPARVLYRKLLQQGSRFASPGKSTYDAEWDLLIVLDACRYDLFADLVADPNTEFDFIDRGTLTTTRSVESVTRLWMRRTFDPTVDGVAQTHYVVGNPWSSQELDEAWFASLDAVWEDAWDDDSGTLRPDTVTDRALAASRSVDFETGDRLLVHYMQPHCPFIPTPDAIQSRCRSTACGPSRGLRRQLETRATEPPPRLDTRRPTQNL